MSCVWFADVWAEKLTLFGMYFSFGNSRRKAFVIADFPVPVGPTKSNGLSFSKSLLRKKFCFSVSTVLMINSVT